MTQINIINIYLLCLAKEVKILELIYVSKNAWLLARVLEKFDQI